MKGIELLDTKQWQPFSSLNFTHPFFSLNRETIINTWVVLAILFLLSLIARFYLNRKQSMGRYLVLTVARSLIDLCNQALGSFSFNHVAFISTLFIFIMTCNCIALIPFTSEPTQDLNTTLGLGILSFLYVQYYAIKTHGAQGYLKEFFTPIFIMFPLHVIGKLASLVSISFRLFGNIFGAATIMHIYIALISSSIIGELLGLFGGFNMIMALFFVVFEGLLQAFVFTMLSLTYLAIAISHEEEG